MNESASWGIPVTSLDALVGTTATNGTRFGIPGNKAAALTWTTSFSSAPSAVSLILQLSLDGVTYYTGDTSTSTSGEIRTINTSAKFARIRLVSKTGGGTTTAIFIVQPYYATIINAGSIFDFTLAALIEDGTNGQVLTTDGAGLLTFETAGIAVPVSLANGGTGSILVDPGADRIYFWDDSAGVTDWLILGDNLSITDKTINAAGGNPFDQDLNTDDNVQFFTLSITDGASLASDGFLRFPNFFNVKYRNVADDNDIVAFETDGDALTFQSLVEFYENVLFYSDIEVQGNFEVGNDLTAGGFIGTLFGSVQGTADQALGLVAGSSTAGNGQDVNIFASPAFDNGATPTIGGNVLLQGGAGAQGGASGDVLVPEGNLVATNTVKGTLRTNANATTGLSAGALSASTNASIVITDGAGQVYRVPCII